ncbi:Anti-sigma factor N-terminus [Desulfotomaculum arcticum]|uniref:Anti-sigma factor N-terminus n=1 Tax=Desulfotruncus arcticus DSM 17038 TaxID=1121424 RepID=A0A1I2UJ75_9FIRM|nr:anti-sigma factor domain-containing protein [Desulfotruncus arcticus]SFG77093.1 Anti-sigma factor N-terminus [Desulfotomaculum arcticum] [Desulfotruncus arcticus DSM 17038]
MKKGKGVVFNITGLKTIIYTEEGTFLKIPTPEPKPLVGQTIEYTAMSRPFFFSPKIIRYATVAAALILVLALGLFTPLFGIGGAVAAVELDINHGVSLQVNKYGKITSAYATGRGPGGVLDDLKLKGRDIYQATRMIIQNAEAKGILGKEENVIMVSVVPMGSGEGDAVNPEKLRGIVKEEMVRQNASGVILVNRVNDETIQHAQNLGMTVNNYLIYERCLQNGLDARADVFRKGDVRGVITKTNVSLPELFPKECMEVNAQEQQNAGRTTNGEIEHNSAVEPEHRQNGSGRMMPAGEAGHMNQENTHGEIESGGEIHNMNSPGMTSSPVEPTGVMSDEHRNGSSKVTPMQDNSSIGSGSLMQSYSNTGERSGHRE